MTRYNLFEVPHIPANMFNMLTDEEKYQFIKSTKQSMVNNIETLKESFFVTILQMTKLLYPGVINDPSNMWWGNYYIKEAEKSLAILKDEVNNSIAMKDFQEFRIQIFGVINGRIANIIYNVCNKYTPKEFVTCCKEFYEECNLPKLVFANDDTVKLFSGWHCVLEYTLDDIEMVTNVFRGRVFQTEKFYIDLEDAFKGRESL